MKPITLVHWDDAHGNTDTFNDIDLDHKPWRFTTIGFLIKDDAKGISLAMDVTEDGVYRDHRFIPRQMIASMEIIKQGRTPRKPKVKAVVDVAKFLGDQ